MRSEFLGGAGAGSATAPRALNLSAACLQWRLVQGVWLLAAMGATSMAHAEGALLPDSLRPFVSAGVEQDNNLFRDPNNEESDTITSLGVGLDLNLELSRQRITGHLAFANRYYATNDYLDYGKTDGEVRWNWRVGSDWWGVLAQDYVRDLRSFVNSDTRQKEIREAATTTGEVYRAIGSDWRVRLDLDYYALDYHETHTQDRTSSTLGGELQYKTALDTYIGLRAAFMDTQFPNRQIINENAVSGDYQEDLLAITVRWNPTARSSLQAALGRSRLEYDAFPDDDVTGRRYRLSYRWDAGAKLDLKFDAWQQINPRHVTNEDEDVSAVESQGIAFEPRWRITSLISLRARLAVQQRDFTGEADRLPSGEQRQEDMYGASLGAVYTVPLTRNGVDFTADVVGSSRDSNVEGDDYDDLRWLVGVRANF